MRSAPKATLAILSVAILVASARLAAGQTCDAAPLAGCKQPVVADKALLLLKSKGGDGDKLIWKWLKGDATVPDDLGDPPNETSYTLCVYDETAGTPALKLTAFIPAGGDCGGKPCWSVTGSGFKYKDASVANAGIKNVLLKVGDAGKAKVIVKGKDANLNLPPLPLSQDDEVIVQLKNDLGVCWEARYAGPATSNDESQFKDKASAGAPGPTSTPTPDGPTPTVTATPTTGGGGNCGNGLLESDETCASCAADCVVNPCTATSPTIAFAVDLVPPLGEQPTSATVLLAYRSQLMSIPGSGNELSVRQRVLPPAPLPSSFAVNDLNYAVRVVVSRNTPLGRLFTATFDRCTGQPAPTLSDLACTVEGCASGGTPVEGCGCTVVLP